LPILLAVVGVGLGGCAITFNPDPAVWTNVDPAKKTITIKNISNEGLTWRDLFVFDRTGGTYFKPAGMTTCPLPGAAFAAGATCTAEVEREAFVAGKKAYLVVEVEKAGRHKLYADPLETR
jgi:hypothetical protein